MSEVRCLLWDFGDTLCDERFIWGSGPEWMEVYRTFDDGIGDRWSTHELDTAAFAAELSARLGRAPGGSSSRTASSERTICRRPSSRSTRICTPR